MSKTASLLDKSFIKFVVEQGGCEPDGVAAQLQLACAQGNSDYVLGLQKGSGSKDLMELAKKMILKYEKMKVDEGK